MIQVRHFQQVQMKGAKWRNFINVRREGKTIMPFPWTKSAKVLVCARGKNQKRYHFAVLRTICFQIFQVRYCWLGNARWQRTRPCGNHVDFRVSFELPFAFLSQFSLLLNYSLPTVAAMPPRPGRPHRQAVMLTRRSLAAWKGRSDSRIVPTSAAAAAHPHIEGDTEYGRHVLRRIMASESAKCSGPQHLEGWGVSVLYITHFMLCITFAV